MIGVYQKIDRETKKIGTYGDMAEAKKEIEKLARLTLEFFNEKLVYELIDFESDYMSRLTYIPK